MARSYENKNPTRFEPYQDLFLVIGVLLMIFSYVYREVIFLNAKAISNDTAAWYGVFHYFVESVLSGNIPYWNPYSHGGEPFYFNFALFHLIDPTMALPLLFAKLAKTDLFQLYNGYCVFKEFFYCVGILCLCRYLFKSRFVFLSLSLLFLFIYRNDVAGLLKRETLMWVPWISLAFIHTLRVPNRTHFIISGYLLGTLIGSGNQTAFYFIVFLFLFIFGVLLAYPKAFKKFAFENKVNLLLSLGILCLLSLPLLSTLLDNGKIFSVGESFVSRDYAFKELAKGKSYFPIDYLSNFIDGNYFSGLALNPKMIPNFLLGTHTSLFAFALFFLIYGILQVSFPLKKPFIVAALGMIVFSLAKTKIYYFLFTHLPPLQYIKHPIGFLFLLEPFFIIVTGFALQDICDREFKFPPKIWLSFLLLPFLLFLFHIPLYFPLICIGLWILVSPFIPTSFKKFVFLTCGTVLFLFSFGEVLQQWTGNLRNRQAIVSELNDIYSELSRNHFRSSPISFDPIRKFALARPGVLLFEPLLLKQNVALTTILEPTFGKATRDIAYLRLVKDPVMSNRVPYWPLPYVLNYQIGEENPGAFFDIMGIGKSMIRFYPNDSVMLLSHEQQKNLFKGFSNPLLSAAPTDSYTDHWLFLNNEHPIESQLPNFALHQFTKAEPNGKFDYKLNDFTTNGIKFSCTVPKLGYLLYNDTFDADWTAKIDGKITPISQANLSFKAIPLQPGFHQVEFRYFPMKYALSLYLYIAFQLGFLSFAMSKIPFFNLFPRRRLKPVIKYW